MEPKPTYKIEPNAVEAEQAFLGSVLLQGSEVITQDAPDLKPEHFFIVKHQWIFKAMLDLRAAGHVVDVVTVSGALGERSKEVGGLGYLMQLSTAAPSSMNAEGYAALIFKTYIQRQVLRAAVKIAALAYYEGDALVEAKRVLQAIESPADSRDIRPASEIAHDVWAQISDIDALNDRLIRTGLAALDAGCGGGFERGNLVLLAGRPGMGKTALECQLAYYFAKQGLVVVFFQLEMMAKEIVRRMAFQQARLNWMAYKARRYTGENEAKAFEALLKQFCNMPETLLIDDTPALSTDQCEAKLMRVAEKYGRIDAIFGDHLDLFRAGSRMVKGENEPSVKGHISRAAKEWAKKFDAVSVFAAQLSRINERDADKRPTLNSIRNTGEHEQNADIVTGLYRPGYYSGDKEDYLFEAVILKNRDGETSTQYLNFYPQYGVFEGVMGNAHKNAV